MPTLTLKINDKVYDKVLWFLNQFKKSDVEIIDTNIDSEKTSDDKPYIIEEVNNLAKEAVMEYDTKNDYSFEKIKREVEKDFEDARKPGAKFYTLEEADIILDKVIAQYENNSNE